MFYLIYSSLQTVYTYDNGFSGVRVGLVSLENGIQIQQSQKGSKETPNIFGYLTTQTKNETVERLVFGDLARVAESRNSSKVQTNPFRFLTNHTGYKFNNIHPSIVSALSIRNLVNSVNQKDSLIISVPSASTPHYRTMVHEVGQIAGFTDVEIVDDSTSLATYYGFEKYNRTSRIAKSVLFIDISATRTEITKWTFNGTTFKINMTLNDYMYTDKVSGNVIDELFADFISAKISGKIENRDELLKIGKKAKELLTYNESVQLEVFETKEMVNFTREDAKQITAKITENLVDILSKFSSDTVEVAGGASKYFAFEEVINSSFPNSNISNTMQSVDSISLGTSFYGALKNKIISNIKLIISRPAIYDYSVIKGGKQLQLLKGGSPYIRKFFNVLENQTFGFELSAKLPESLYQKVDVETSKRANGPYTHVTVDGFEKFNTNDKLLLNVTLLPTRSFGEFVVTRVAGKSRKLVFDITERVPNPEIAAPSSAFTTMKQEVELIKKLAAVRQMPKVELEELLADAKDKILFDAVTAIVTDQHEMEEFLAYIDECLVNITDMKKKKLKKLNQMANLKLSPIIVKTEEFKERPFAANALQSAIDRVESRIPFATSVEAEVQIVRDYLRVAKEYLKKATEIGVKDTPVILCKDLRRRAETILSKESDLFTGARKSSYEL